MNALSTAVGRRFAPGLAVLLLPILAGIARPAGANDLILKIGDPAPHIGTAGYTIDSFVEAPSINGPINGTSAWVVFHVTIAGPNVIAANSHVIYRWSRSTGIEKVARGGEVIVFEDTSQRTLTFLETPMVDEFGWVAFTSQLDDGRRGLVVWSSPTTLRGVAHTGQEVVITCESISGAPCGPAVGTMTTMATFGDRRGAVFAGSTDPFFGGTNHRVLFRGAVQATGFGTPDALWLRDYSEGFPPSPLRNVANSLQKADGTGSNNTYFDDFTDVALCSGFYATGLATVSRDAPFAVYEYDEFDGDHTLITRSHAPDMVPRRDYHCLGSRAAYAGGVSPDPFDGDVTNKGVWLIEGGGQAPIYLNTIAPAPDISGAVLGIPLGQALASHFGEAQSVFATRIVGGFATNGRAGIWRSPFGGPIKPVGYESQEVGIFSFIDRIYTASVSRYGDVVLHLTIGSLGPSYEAIRIVSAYGTASTVLTVGDSIDAGSSGQLVIDGFLTLGAIIGGDTPVVTGGADDGLPSAMSPSGELALVVYTRPPAAALAGGPRGAAIMSMLVQPTLFADGFED
jgi:hypothetical protein